MHSRQNSALRTPLNEILGSRGHILVLRQLVKLENPASHSELHDRTGLSRQGVYDVVVRLIETGILRYVGSGRQQHVNLRNEHPLANVIRQLFKSEKERYSSLIKRLQQEISTIEQKPTSVWIFGQVARGTDEYGDPVQIALLGDVKSVDSQTDSFRNRLYQAGIESDYDVTIDIRGVTVADLESRPALIDDEVILLWGIDPQSILERPGKNSGKQKTHRELDARSLTDAKAWTDLLRKYPEIVSRTINYLDEHIPQISSGEKKELQEWKHILETMSYQRLKKFLLSNSERSVRLRQSLPFWPALNEKERTELLESKSEQGQSHE